MNGVPRWMFETIVTVEQAEALLEEQQDRLWQLYEVGPKAREEIKETLTLIKDLKQHIRYLQLPPEAKAWHAAMANPNQLKFPWAEQPA